MKLFEGIAIAAVLALLFGAGQVLDMVDHLSHGSAKQLIANTCRSAAR
jgi:hypothetical protein